MFTTEAIGYLMGAFELNNLRLTVADPLGAHIDALDAVEEGETAAREASAHEQPVEAAMRVLARHIYRNTDDPRRLQGTAGHWQGGGR